MERLRVLIVDDSLVMRAMIEEIVATDPGSRALASAGDIATAREMIEDLPLNVITLDLNMQGPSGFELLTELQGLNRPPVVVVSSAAKAYSEVEERALALGAYACFDKSRLIAHADQFLQLLKDAAARRPRDILPDLPSDIPQAL